MEPFFTAAKKYYFPTCSFYIGGGNFLGRDWKQEKELREEELLEKGE
jgi:hypothetical protein